MGFLNAGMLDLHSGAILRTHTGAHMWLGGFLVGINTQSALPRSVNLLFNPTHVQKPQYRFFLPGNGPFRPLSVLQDSPGQSLSCRTVSSLVAMTTYYPGFQREAI